MPNIPSSGAIKFSDLKTDFGDTSPSSISEFYKGGGKVLSTVDGDTINSSVPASGEVSLSDYFNAKGYFVHTISANVSDVDLPSVLSTAGWNGSQPVYLIVNANIYVYGLPRSSTMSPGIKIENNTSNPYYITIKNNGYIFGAGGTDVGNGAAPTEAIKCSGSNAVYLTIKNTNFINGGGGAGKQITRQTSSSSSQYFGGGGGGAGGGHGDGLFYFNGSSSSTQAQKANGITNADGVEGQEGEGSDTNTTSGNYYALTGGGAGGGAGGGLYDGIRIGGAQGGGMGGFASLPTVFGNWSNYDDGPSGISLAAGGANNNAGESGISSGFNQNVYSSGQFGAGAGGGWGADGGNGMQYFWNGTVTSVHDTNARYDGASAIKNTSTGGSTTVESGLGGTMYGDVT
jgi:hypothetical protein